MNDIIFDYYRGVEAEQYSFYRIPKMLFTDTIFQDLSCEAKVLYGLMLDRMSLSLKNHWMDEEERVYIIFTVNNICDLMNCGTQKAVRLLKELDVKTGIGLIEKKRLGLGKPNVIYVKNFIIKEFKRGDSPLNSSVSLSSQLSLFFSRDLIRTLSFPDILILRLLIVNVSVFNSPFLVDRFSINKRRDSPRTVVLEGSFLLPMTTVTL